MLNTEDLHRCAEHFCNKKWFKIAFAQKWQTMRVADIIAGTFGFHEHSRQNRAIYIYKYISDNMAMKVIKIEINFCMLLVTKI